MAEMKDKNMTWTADKKISENRIEWKLWLQANVP